MTTNLEIKKPAKTSVEILENWLISQISEQILVSPETIDINKPLTYYGLDSIIAFTIVGDLEDWLEIELPSTLLWDYPTIEQVAKFLIAQDISLN